MTLSGRVRYKNGERMRRTLGEGLVGLRRYVREGWRVE